MLGVAIAALMEVIDTSITNVALPHIQGNLGATTSEAAWVVTAYSFANVITMQLAVMLGQMFGKKSYFIFSNHRLYLCFNRLRHGYEFVDARAVTCSARTFWRRIAG